MTLNPIHSGIMGLADLCECIIVLADLCTCIIGLALHSAMVGVGNSYTDGDGVDSECKLQGVYFLKVAGGFGITMDILGIIFNCININISKGDDVGQGGAACGCVAMIGNFVIFIWGSVIIFGPYQNWTYSDEDQMNEYYCAYTPYMFSFVMLILGWVFMAVRTVFVCVLFARQ